MTPEYRKWTTGEDQRLLELKKAGKAYSVIAKELSRTETAVVDRAGVLKRRDKMINCV